MSDEKKPKRSKTSVEKSTGKAKASPKRPRARTRYLALEPRVVFDGALAADIVDKATEAPAQSEPTFEAPAPAVDWLVARAPAQSAAATVDQRGQGTQETPVPQISSAAGESDRAADRLVSEAPPRLEVVFVDTTVEDYQTLLTGVNPDARVVLLDGSRDAVDQMLDALEGMGQVDALHIVSHGSEGVLQLGGATIDAESMRTTYAGRLAALGTHLSADADILVYGCDFAQGEAGRDAATRLSLLTGADVAASDDLTGHESLGGDWDLEAKFGAIETSVVFTAEVQRAFMHTLATLDWDAVGVDWATGDLSQTYAVAGAGEVTIDITGDTVGDFDPGGYPSEGAGWDGGTGQNGLQLYVNSFDTTAEFIDIKVSFSADGGVSNVSFNLFDVDRNPPSGFIDKLTITAVTTDGSTINPTSVTGNGSSSWTFNGTNVITGTAASNNTGAGAGNGTALVSFGGAGITQIVIRYQNDTATTGQAISLHDINYTTGVAAAAAPVIDLDASSAAGVTVATDDFATAADYTKGSGWTGNWVESDAGGGGATSGDVRVTGGALVLDGATTTTTQITRSIDLSGYVDTTLSFDYNLSTTTDITDNLVVEISRDGGTTFTVLKTISNTSANSPTALTGTATIDIGDYAVSNAVLRFRLPPDVFNVAGETVTIDNVKITGRATGFASTYTEGDATGVTIADIDTTVIDADSTLMSKAVVKLGNIQAGDTLTWDLTATPGISAAYDGGTGVLTLTGSASEADYQTALETIRFKSTSEDPGVNGTQTTRAVTVQVYDEANRVSNTATGTVTVVSVNDAPVNTVSASQSTVVGVPLTFSAANGNQLSVSDVDAATVQVTLAVDAGSITLSGIAGLTFSVGDGTSDTTMTFSGTKAAVNAALAGLQYVSGTAT